MLWYVKVSMCIIWFLRPKRLNNAHRASHEMFCAEVKLGWSCAGAALNVSLVHWAWVVKALLLSVSKHLGALGIGVL